MSSTRAAARSLRIVAGAILDAAAWPAVAKQSAARASTGVVVARRLKLLGAAITASQRVVSQTELVLLPAYRPAQLVETVPGLAATVHSGEGKASQYLMRGYNLDHGTDFAFYVAALKRRRNPSVPALNFT
ncbi:MAG: hypothetical protein ACREFT_01540 [Acetobacteraceae bacterium]